VKCATDVAEAIVFQTPSSWKLRRQLLLWWPNSVWVSEAAIVEAEHTFTLTGLR
jgi:hypothetical protein